ncbi:Protein tyrosine kinase [Carpediemonas membranifera]|uniref:Protein tyrosine kinase n=1 Tax=Carpediemonas membranifera TaxID=201153 RepID=A0A8J6E2Q4_9EUKA|nr:Protein tyrosine kinase [Carpediemonas membranifera]|eukprot:KAG9394616.1 Protein tyrosine kinase [Carpediemonas membranifera]
MTMLALFLLLELCLTLSFVVDTVDSPGQASSLKFGSDVAIDGNVMIVGRGDPISAQDAYDVFTYLDGRWVFAHPVVPTTRSYPLGGPVALNSKWLIAAGSYAGVAIVFSRHADEFTLMTQVEGPDGCSAISSIDLDEDSAIVGASLTSTATLTEVGVAFIIALEHGDWTSTAVLTAPKAYSVSYANFGSSVALEGNVALISASGVSCVFVISRENPLDSWQYEYLFQDVASTSTGHQLAYQGGLAVIGSPGLYMPSALVKRRDGVGQWSDVVSLTSDEGTPTLFGQSVAISGDMVVVGAPSSLIAPAVARINIYNTSTWVGQVIRDIDVGDTAFGSVVAITDRFIAVASTPSVLGSASSAGEVYSLNTACGEGQYSPTWGSCRACPRGTTSVAGSADCSPRGSRDLGPVILVALVADTILALVLAANVLLGCLARPAATVFPAVRRVLVVLRHVPWLTSYALGLGVLVLTATVISLEFSLVWAGAVVIMAAVLLLPALVIMHARLMPRKSARRPKTKTHPAVPARAWSASTRTTQSTPTDVTALLARHPSQMSIPDSPASGAGAIAAIEYTHDQLELCEIIGQGGFGNVFRGDLLGTPCAVKESIVRHMGPSGLRNVVKELAIHSSLVHPGVIQLLGFVRLDGKLLICLELADGSLYDLIHSNETLPWSRRWDIAASIAQTLAFIYLRGVQHRDLKSKNILMVGDRCKISDFGTSREAIVSTASTVPQYTPAWAAPERFSWQFTEKSDVYSFGVVMWELATREKPFAGMELDAIVKSILSGERLQFPADTPAEFATIAMRCWAPDPEHRPSFEELGQMLVGRSAMPGLL